MQGTLKAQNGLKHFRAIANSPEETPMKLARADAHCLAKLINATGRMAGQPMECAAHRAVRGVTPRQPGGHDPLEQGSFEGKGRLIEDAGERRQSRLAADVAKRCGEIQQCDGRCFEEGWGPARMKAQANDFGPGSKIGEERFLPRADQQRRYGSARAAEAYIAPTRRWICRFPRATSLTPWRRSSD